MKTLILFCALFTAFVSQGKIEMKSIYFDTDATNSNGVSNGALDSLKTLIRETDFQVIEVNSFSNIEGSSRKSLSLSNKRVNFVLNTLNIEKGNISINAYGNQRISLNFEPESWNRIDIYYSVSIKAPTAEISDIAEEDSLIPSEQIAPKEIVTVEPVSKSKDKDKLEVPELSEIVANVPMVLPIEFIGGKLEIVSKDKEYLEYLYNVLSTHSILSAHIKGHVCCQKNKRKSKLRAKVIYDYLVDKGIDKKRLSFKGYSNSQPIATPELNEKDRKLNRRVEIVFSK